MKKIIFFVTALLMMGACAENTLNDKAESLIEKDMETTLVKPDTYDAIETETDSAFAPMDNPALFTLMLDIAKENIAISKIEESIGILNQNIRNAEQGMNISSLKKDGLGKDNYNNLKNYREECKRQIAKIEPEMDVISARIQDKLKKIKELSNSKREFIGYKSIHRYSAENQDGKELTDSCYYLFDKGMSKVVLSLPLDKYNVIVQMVNTLESSDSLSAK